VRFGQKAEPAVLALAGALGDPSLQLRLSAAKALAGIGQGATAAVPALITALGDRDDFVKESVTEALVRIGPAAIEPLITCLHHPRWIERAGAAKTLGLIGPRAKAAVGALIGALGEEHYGVRTRATEALVRIGQAAIDALTTAQSDPRPEVRAGAADVLRRIRGG
jgi:HEAT repeat protein